MQVSIARLEPGCMHFELSCCGDQQKQQDAPERRIWARIVLLRMIVHDRTNEKNSRAPAGGRPMTAANMKEAAYEFQTNGALAS
jgi:hypothetical protein